MSLVSVTVNGTYKDGAGNLLTGKKLIFKPLAVFGDGGVIVPKKDVVVTTHATTAVFSTALLTSDLTGAYVRYQVTFHTRDKKKFDLTDDTTPISLEDLINAFDGAQAASAAVSIVALQAADAQNVKLTGNQTVAGVKTFSEQIKLPDPAYDNWYGTPLVNFLSIGEVARRAVASGIFTSAEIGHKLTITGGGPHTGLLTSLDVQGTMTDTSIRGHYIDIFSNSTTPSGTNDELIGIETLVDVGGAWTSAFGARLKAQSGGSGASGLENIYGVQAIAGMAHNGNTTNAFGGDFFLDSTASTPSVVTNAVGVRSRARLRDDVVVTNLTGIKVGNWELPGTGFPYNTIGLHIDNTIDVGFTTRYAIKSDAISDSLFAGAVRGPLNAYSATLWNGSTRFATEDAIRDKLEGAGKILTTYQSADVAYTNQAVLQDTDLVVTVEAGRYLFRIGFQAAPGGTTAALSGGFGGTATVTYCKGGFHAARAGGSVGGKFTAVSDTLTLTTATVTDFAGTIHGVIEFSVAGTFIFKASQHVSHGTAVTLFAGTNLQMIKMD